MLRRLIKWIFILAVLVVLFVGFGLPLLANTETGRKNLAKILGRGVDREVAIGGLSVGWFFTSLDVKDLRIDNPPDFPKGAFLKAGRLSFDSKLKDLLDGKVRGGLTGEGIDVHIIRKGGKTNLDGFGKSREAPPGEEPGKEEPKEGEPAPETEERGKGPDVNLGLELTDSRLTIEDLDKGEKLVLEGVGLEMRFSNREGEQDAGLKIRIKSIDRDALSVRDLEIDAKTAGDLLLLENLRANLPGAGKLTGTGQMRVRGGDDWQVKLDALDVGINDDMMPIVAALYPFAAKAKGMDGKLDASFDVRGNGLTWEAMKPALDGNGKVSLSGIQLPRASLLAQAAALAGRGEGALDISKAGAQFDVKDGWLNFSRLFAAGSKVNYDLAGRVSLDGALDLNMDLMPLVKAFGGGERYSKVAEHLDKLPVRITGTTADPKLKAPKAEDLIKAGLGKRVEKEVEKGLGGILDKIGKKKKD